MNVSGAGAARATTGVSPATWNGASRPPGGSGAVGRMQVAIGAVSQLLNTQPSDLVRQLGSGTSLSSIVSAAGVSGQNLLATVSKAVGGFRKARSRDAVTWTSSRWLPCWWAGRTDPAHHADRGGCRGLVRGPSKIMWSIDADTRDTYRPHDLGVL